MTSIWVVLIGFSLLKVRQFIYLCNSINLWHSLFYYWFGSWNLNNWIAINFLYLFLLRSYSSGLEKVFAYFRDFFNYRYLRTTDNLYWTFVCYRSIWFKCSRVVIVTINSHYFHRLAFSFTHSLSYFWSRSCTLRFNYLLAIMTVLLLLYSC
jgi:hypothetical protein